MDIKLERKKERKRRKCMPHSAVSQNNYQVKFISLHMNRSIGLVHYFNNLVIGSLTPKCDTLSNDTSSN